MWKILRNAMSKSKFRHKLLQDIGGQKDKIGPHYVEKKPAFLEKIDTNSGVITYMRSLLVISVCFHVIGQANLLRGIITLHGKFLLFPGNSIMQFSGRK